MSFNCMRKQAARFTVFMLLVGSGCSGRGDGRPQIAPVRGQVTYRGQPVAKASVTFFNDQAPRTASGQTDETGHYRLTTFEPDDGAVIGEHAVTVYKSKMEVETIGVDPSLGPQAYLEALEAASAQAIKAQQAGSSLPRRYVEQSTTDVHERVAPGENVIDIELVD